MTGFFKVDISLVEKKEKQPWTIHTTSHIAVRDICTVILFKLNHLNI